MTGKRTQNDAAYKLEIAKMVIDQCLAVAEVAALRAKGIHLERYKACRIMCELNIKPVWGRKTT